MKSTVIYKNDETGEYLAVRDHDWGTEIVRVDDMGDKHYLSMTDEDTQAVYDQLGAILASRKAG